MYRMNETNRIDSLVKQCSQFPARVWEIANLLLGIVSLSNDKKGKSILSLRSTSTENRRAIISTQRLTRVWSFTVMLWEICSLFSSCSSAHRVGLLSLHVLTESAGMRTRAPPSPSTLMLSWGWCCSCYSIGCQLLKFIMCVPWMPISPTTTFFLAARIVCVCSGRVELPISASGIYRKHERAKFFLCCCLDKIPGIGKFMSSIRWRDGFKWYSRADKREKFKSIFLGRKCIFAVFAI